METTTKEVCRIIVNVLLAQGVRHFVVSPGSRNTPLLVALARRKEAVKYVVVDERSAAFTALGLTQQLNEPVGIVCTSGTALLNYAPAVAEAYYQKLPLIVISADRPKEWIDQDDSQTIRQFEALSQFVKKSYDLPSRCDDATARWYANRIVNDAVAEATSGRRAPVHINVQLDEPLSLVENVGEESARRIDIIEPSPTLSPRVVAQLAAAANGRKVLVVAGFLQPDERLQAALHRLAGKSNVAVLTETISNLHSERFIPAIDRTLLAMGKDSAPFVPDVLITIGGALISRIVKAFMRKQHPAEHWHVGITDTTVDCMQALTRRIMTDPAVFFEAFASSLEEGGCRYHDVLGELAARGMERHEARLAAAPWSDMRAFSRIIPSIPKDYHLQLSNGTTIRYAQLFGDGVTMRNDCNRGVSGIDGSTSTAVGASLAYDGVTLLITGDMSFSYDLPGLGNGLAASRLKIIVMQNGGGGIFRFIKSTSELPELEEYFEVHRDVPVKRYAEAFDFAYFEAADEAQLEAVLPAFYAECERKAILAVKTDNVQSATTLQDYFSRKKDNKQ